MRTVEVPRPPRTGPRLPGGELTIEPPEPERPVPPAPSPGAAGGDAAGLGRVRRPGGRDPSSLMFGGMFALSTVGMLLVGGGGRSAGQRQAASTRNGATTCATWRPRGAGCEPSPLEQRAALEHVHPDPAAWPAVLAAGRRSGAPGHGSRLRRAARGHRSAAAGHDAGRPSDGPGGGARAGHGARPAPLPACARGRPRPAGRAVAAWHRCDLARGRTGRRTRARPRTGPRPRGAVRAVAQPGRRAAGRGGTAVPGAGVGVGGHGRRTPATRGTATRPGRRGW